MPTQLQSLAQPAPRQGARPAVRLANVSRSYGERRGPAVQALAGVSMCAGPGELLAVVGPSGCGKTTLLELICGLQVPDEGSIACAPAALMPQRDLLLPWLNAIDNAALALRIAGLSRAKARRRAAPLFAELGLDGFQSADPRELSGGMRQRVALARALAQQADVLLMDEPFGALDAMTRDVLHDEVERIWRETHVSVVFVTHNVREAVRLGDRVVLLSSRPGRVIAEFPVHFARPRRIDSPEVATLAASITDQLRSEVMRHGDGH